MSELSLTDVPPRVREVAEIAVQTGNSIETIAQWSKMLVVHMRNPLDAAQRSKLQTEFSDLEYARYDGDPHNPPDEIFFDGRKCAGVSFPLR